jgi:hypothetical protein
MLVPTASKRNAGAWSETEQVAKGQSSLLVRRPGDIQHTMCSPAFQQNIFKGHQLIHHMSELTPTYRCHRLSKECIPSAPMRKGNVKRAASKRSQLEDKLEDLVSLLRTQHTAQQHDSLTPRLSDYSPQQNDAETPDGNTLSDDELAKFRQIHLPYFPLIHLPPSLSATQLQLEKPLLSSAIHVISNKAHSRQQKLARILRETVSSRLLVDGEKSIDLLLTVEVCVAWSHYVTFGTGKGFLGMFVSIAKSLLTDLALDRPRRLLWCPSKGPPMQNTEANSRSNQSIRAVLACYALSAMSVPHYLQRA